MSDSLHPIFASILATHGMPQVTQPPADQPRMTLHEKAMSAVEAAIREVHACHAPGRFDCGEVLELLGDAKVLLRDVYYTDSCD